ncbi:alcohol dehydrogenase [Paenibacillus sp. J31TS4]|uniref:NAD(P)-dependent alcohol dehydrogenase n=1 Tax=Paenibacillus sp. J31TS4 TaxID=2807195 RepID=UPI001B2BDEBD|nr:NAD(P)-dependent alcohol dehydrogenase [Paenibacillus sp. J31TS4]GIP37708.1 alcohol dehydrogenase [Paenibacillus sp. J31TS4]
MKAIVYEQYGPPSVLKLQEVAKPIPKSGEILIQVYAATAAAGDWRLRKADPFLARLFNGLWRPKRIKILGFELAGVVESTGSGVTRFKPGDAVYAACGNGFGAYAEYKCLPETGAVACKPANLSFEEAAAVPVGAYTALQFLRKGKIKPGARVLVYGASGSVGTYAVQLAKHLGAQVTGVCSTANVDLVRSLGAGQVIDYTKERVLDGNAVYDLIFDTVGKSPFQECIKQLAPSGCYLRAFHVNPWLIARGGWVNLTSGKRVIGGTMKESAEDLTYLKELIEQGVLRPVIDRRYPLEQAAEAHRYVEQGHKKGNVVLTVHRH